MKALITAIIISLFATFISAQVSPTSETEIKTAVVHFKVNSSTVYSMDAAQMQEVANATIIGIEGYASIEGNSIRNLDLSQARAQKVKDLFHANSSDAEISCFGGTEFFGTNKADNRVVVVTYVVFKQSTPVVTDIVDTTTAPVKYSFQNAEGFNCGNVIDPSIYFEDTIAEVAVIPNPIVVETIIAELPVITSVIIPEVARTDTFFLPTRQAVRFQMKEHGMSRSEAIKSIEARKSQWKPISKKKKATKRRLPKKTMGKNDSFWSHIRPFRGC